MNSKIKKITLLASGNGSNVENIIKFFDKNPMIEVVLVAGNKRDAKVFERVKQYKIDTFIFNKYNFNENFIDILDKYETDLIVLAGFLWKIPKSLINRYKNKIINIHPSLLPLYGGKGMYGMNVHKAVISNKEKKTGISIHEVNEDYDKGKIIFQAKILVLPEDTIESLASRVQDLEKEHFPNIIKEFLLKIK
tara:strand:- start:11983 stop:12561 length:579 start_codon:yes stop_codon:yes gene_type:complete